MSEEFNAAPKVVRPKQKYKEEEPEQEEDQIKLIYNNLMWDKRIFRGSPMAPVVTLKNKDVPLLQKTKPRLRPKVEQTDEFDQSNKRKVIEIFTDEFVETLTDKPPLYEYGQQTDSLPQTKVTRHWMEKKKGLDMETQIWDDELFDFDYEVEPLLNVLCGRTLQLSRMEVLQEQQLRVMSNRQQELKLGEQKEAFKIQQMYELEEKLEKENLKVIQQFQNERELKCKTHKRLFSRVLAKQYLRDIKANTLALVQAHGFFRDPIEGRLINQILPKFIEQTLTITHSNDQLLRVAWDIVEEAKASLLKEHAWAKELEKTRRGEILKKRKELASEKLARKAMREEEEQMRRFLADERVHLEREAQRQREEEAKAAAGGTEVVEEAQK